MRPLGITAIALTLGVAFGGCGATDPTPVPTVDKPTATADLTLGVVLDHGKDVPSVDPALNTNQLSVQGTVIEILPAQWTTKDGTPPLDPVTTFSKRDATIITPVVLRLEGDPIFNNVPDSVPFDPQAATIVLAVYGGKAGDVEARNLFHPDTFQLGNGVIVILRTDAQDGMNRLAATPAGPGWGVVFAYPLPPSGTP